MRCLPPALTLFAALAALSGVPARAQPEPPRPPNLVFVIADDLGWGDVGANGNPSAQTPRIDAFAAEGARFDRIFASPASAPSSAAILTGLHPLLAGVCSDTQGAQALHENMVTIAEKLEPLGYQSGYFGAWRHGANRPNRPDDQGFKTFVGVCQGSWTDRIEFGDEEHPLEDDPGGVLVREVLKFVENNAAAPFLCILHHPAPARTGGGDLAQISAAVSELDFQFGQILDQLAALDLEKNTVVFFLSDNGPTALEGRFNGRMHGARGSLHEGGLRVPCFVRWPEVIPSGSVSDEIAHLMDLHTTAIDFAGGDLTQTLEPPRVRWLQGMSQAPLLRFGASDRWPNRNLNSVAVDGRDFGNMRATVRVSRWRAVRDPAWRRKPPATSEQWELYDILADPTQTYDLAEFYPEVLGRLKSDFMQWYSRVTIHEFEPHPVQIGRADWPRVELLPEIALTPGSSEFVWPLEVIEARDFKISVVYRSAAAGETEARLQVGSAEKAAILAPAPEWTAWPAGAFQLPAGQTEIRLRIPESGVEIRKLVVE